MLAKLPALNIAVPEKKSGRISPTGRNPSGAPGAQGHQGKQRQRADFALQWIVRTTGRRQVRAGVAGSVGEFDLAGVAERIGQPGIGAEVAQMVTEGNRVEG